MNQERPIFEKTNVFWGGNGKAVSFVTQFSFPPLPVTSDPVLLIPDLVTS